MRTCATANILQARTQHLAPSLATPSGSQSVAMDGPTSSAIAKNLKNLRDRAGLTQESVADRLGVSRQAVYLWERGARRPGAELESKLAELFGVSVSALHAEGAAPPPRQDYDLDAYIADRARLGVPLTEAEVEIMRSARFRDRPRDAEGWGKVYRILCLGDGLG